MDSCRRTVNIHVGRKLTGKSRDEILEEILTKFDPVAVQQSLDVIRVTFSSEEDAILARGENGTRLFGLWCRMDGGPPATIVHLFDYPYEEDEEQVKDFFSQYGFVKSVRSQKYLTKPNIYTGTRLIDLVLNSTPPRTALIGGYMCRVWFKGQPIICNLCNVQGHKSATCPDKDKCRLCKQPGHLARNCPNPWGPATSGASEAESRATEADRAAAPVPDPNVVSNDGAGSVEETVELGSAMEVGNLLEPTSETPPVVTEAPGASVSAAPVDESRKSVEGRIEHDGDDPDEAFHDASDLGEPSQGLSQSILHEVIVVAESPHKPSHEMETEGELDSSCLGAGLDDVSVDALLDNLNQNHGGVSSLSQESSVDHDVLPDSFSQDAQRLPDSQESLPMDTSGATLKRKKSELAFKEVPSGRSRSRGPRKKKTGPSASPSPVRGVHSKMPTVASDRPRKV